MPYIRQSHFIRRFSIKKPSPCSVVSQNVLKFRSLDKSDQFKDFMRNIHTLL